jgi:cystathionine beta-synthase
MIPGNFDFNVLDEIIRVEDKESMLMTRALLTKEGLFVGSSGGAAVVGAIRWMQKTKNPGRVLVILPDSGNRYLSKVFNDAWMIENSFLEKRSESTVRDMIKILQKEAKVVSAMSHETVENVVKLMQREGVSQLPVFKNDQIAGIISETALLAPLVSGALKASDSIESLIDPSFTVVSESDPVERLNDIFAAGKMALVGDLGRVKHILTKIDLIGFLSVQ